MNMAAEAGTDPVTSNRTIGRLAVEATTIPEAAHVDLFERLVGTEWPTGFVCEAIDVDSGELQTWNHRSGVSLGRAVAASCAWPGWFPTVEVAGRRYMDGGLYDGMNTQLAAGYDTVICVSCNSTAQTEGLPAAATRRLRNREGLDDLRFHGARIVLVEPDKRFLDVSKHGSAMMDISRVPAAHAAGVEFGAEIAERFAVREARGR